jgi:hypothetical protein
MKKYNTNTSAPHVGQLLKNHIKLHRLHRAVLAKMLGRAYGTVYKYQQNKSMQTAILWELSTALKHNFFMDLAAQLPPGFTTNAPDPTLPFKERIAALEEENKVLTTKVETLMAVVRK